MPSTPSPADGFTPSRRISRADSGHSFPFVAERIRYALRNASLDHDIVLFSGPGSAPSSDPVELLRQTVKASSSEERLIVREVELSHPVEVLEGNDLYVAVQMQGSESQGNPVVATCNLAYPDRDYWSNATTPPYSWVELDNYGLNTTILEVDGQIP